MRLLNALNSEDRGLKVRLTLAMIVFETFELILCQMLSLQGKNAPSNPYPHYLVRLATSREGCLGCRGPGPVKGKCGSKVCNEIGSGPRDTCHPSIITNTFQRTIMAVRETLYILQQQTALREARDPNHDF